MSIGLVLIKATYKETCAICDKISQFSSELFAKTINLCETVGMARAASQLAQMGYHELAKEIMCNNKKK